MKPICVPCQRFFKPKRNGVYFIEGMPTHGEIPARAGTSQPERWKDYKLWVGDLYECAGCGAQTIVGTGLQPLAEHFQSNFNELKMRFGADFRVNDC